MTALAAVAFLFLTLTVLAVVLSRRSGTSGNKTLTIKVTANSESGDAAKKELSALAASGLIPESGIAETDSPGVHVHVSSTIKVNGVTYNSIDEIPDPRMREKIQGMLGKLHVEPVKSASAEPEKNRPEELPKTAAEPTIRVDLTGGQNP